MPAELNYDVVIIGAGIQGAGVAQAAAVCGYKTLIIEKFPAAGMGTSSKSSKLIHGGLRYLETAQFKLVIECLQERKRLLKNAPHLVKLIPFYIPVYAKSIRPAWLIWLGLSIYSIFSLKKFSIVKKSQWKNLDDLKLENLKYVYKYYDAQTNDTHLTQAVIKSAKKYGAEVYYNAEFLKSNAENSEHQLSFRQNNELHNIRCKCIVNCSGPWIESVQDSITPRLKTPKIDLISGTHIIIEQKSITGAYYIQATDRRAIFVLPWGDHKILIGTTEKTYTGSPDKIAPTRNEINYLLENYNLYFNSMATISNITNSFAGLRVLPVSKKNTFDQSRDSLIIHNSDTPALITLVGGKLTTYRASSEKVIRVLKKILPINTTTQQCNTRNIKLK